LFELKRERSISKCEVNVVPSPYFRVNTLCCDFNITAQFDSNRF
jgi:hypothetical protein